MLHMEFSTDLPNITLCVLTHYLVRSVKILSPAIIAHLYRYVWILIIISGVCLHRSMNIKWPDNVATLFSWWSHRVSSVRRLNHNNDGGSIKNQRSTNSSSGDCSVTSKYSEVVVEEADLCNLTVNCLLIVQQMWTDYRQETTPLYSFDYETYNHTWYSHWREQSITWLPISSVFPSDAFTQMNMLDLSSHRKLQVFTV